jgi:MATE family multidrug resistance protein
VKDTENVRPAGAPAVTRAERSELMELISLSWPIMLAQLGTISMSLVDTAILGRVSVVDFAGASIGRAIGFAAATMTMGIATALEPLASQALGAGEPGRAFGAFTATLRATLVSFVPSFLFAMLLTLVLPPLGVEHEVVARARAFLWGQAPQMAFLGVFLAAKVFLQAHRITWPAVVGAIAANVVNVVVCTLLVRGDVALTAIGLRGIGVPALGALGGGLALSVSTFVLMVFVLVPALLRRPAGVRAPVSAKLVWRLGTPVGLHMLAEYGVFTFVAMLTAKLGAQVASAHQVAIALSSFMYMGALGVGGATAVRVGLAVGARRGARRPGLLGLGVGSAFMSIGILLFGVFPAELVDLFTDDPQVIALGASLLRVAAVFQLFDGVQVVMGGALRGAGDVRFPFVINVIAYWGVGVPSALLLGFTFGYGAVGMWVGLTLGLMAAALLLSARFVVLTRGTIQRVES